MTKTEKRKETKAWRKLVGSLRKKFPVSGKVKVTRYPCKKWSGSCTTTGDGCFRIRINSGHDWPGQVDALLHEWAHMLAIEASYGHGSQWGEFYTKLYQAIVEE